MKEDLSIPGSIKNDIISYLSGHLSQDQAERLKMWLNENQRHQRFLDEITDVWRSASTLNNTGYDTQKAWGDISSVIHGKLDRKVPGKNLLSQFWLKIAAVFVVAFLLGEGSILLFKKPASLLNNSGYVLMEAPLGSKAFITLPDGTKAWLNAGTKLRYRCDFGVKTREVTLEGEAYFVVAKNKQKPFIVKTSDINIKALGTVFNVKAYANEKTIETTLEEGMVQIDAVHTGDLQSNFSKPLILKPNQKAVFSRIKEKISKKEPCSDKKRTSKIEGAQKPEEKIKMIKVVPIPDIRLSTSWKDARWVIRHEKLGELAIMLERRYDVTFTFEDGQIKDYVFNGTLLDESLEQVLELIRMAAPIDYTISHKKVTLAWNKQFKDKYQDLLLMNNPLNKNLPQKSPAE